VAKVLKPIRGTFVSTSTLNTNLYDWSRHAHPIQLIVRDTFLLAPQDKRSLKLIGQLCGVEKVEIAEDEIAHMEYLMHEDREAFVQYALRDPEICTKYALQLRALNHEITGKNEVPISLSSIAVKSLLQTWQTNGFDRRAVLGKQLVQQDNWNQKHGRNYRNKVEVCVDERLLDEALAKECYHGGRNEQYFFGAGTPGIWTDYDLAGAYTTAMSVIGIPLWGQSYTSSNVYDFNPATLGYARVEFAFPAGTRFPCLPVRSGSSLIFPLTGESFCCAPEIYLAHQMGAAIRIKRGVIIPDDKAVRPFHAFVQFAAEKRKQYAKGTLENLTWKELANSLYGKTAQGLRNRRCFNAETKGYDNLPESEITNPFFAAYITSFIRATLGEILWSLPASVLVCNATTDGILTTATSEQMEKASAGAICTLFRETRVSLGQRAEIIEAKHRIAQPLGWRTRGQATLQDLPGEPLVLAKAGLKPPRAIKEDHGQNEWIIDLFLNRKPDTAIVYTILRSLSDMVRNGGDLTSLERKVRVRMEYDWKRKPMEAGMRRIRETNHLAFETVPWPSIKQYQEYRAKWEGYRGKEGAVLKTVEDYERFEEYRVVQKLPGLKISKSGGAVGTARRMFLRALTRKVWGLEQNPMTYAMVADWLTAAGYPTSKEDLENANRPTSRLMPHAVPQTKSVQAFIKVIQQEFPSFETHMLIERAKDHRTSAAFAQQSSA
jgi:hypothetical protein